MLCQRPNGFMHQSREKPLPIVSALGKSIPNHFRQKLFSLSCTEAFKDPICGHMDGRVRLVDNIFIESLWRSLKHNEV